MWRNNIQNNFDIDIALYAIAFYLIFTILANVSLQNAILLGHMQTQSVLIQTVTTPSFVRGHKPRHPNRKRSRRNLRFLLNSDELHFRQHFKISRAAFVAIVDAIKRAGFYTTPRPRGQRGRRVGCAIALA